mmetsp:Transcript_13346/g.28741  ORF Transcript_13346/g.28741 Transcript_13346/m.28741 type:complete len:203 (+) Transcript_13346:910-1518(+)
MAPPRLRCTLHRICMLRLLETIARETRRLRATSTGCMGGQINYATAATTRRRNRRSGPPTASSLSMQPNSSGWTCVLTMSCLNWTANTPKCRLSGERRKGAPCRLKQRSSPSDESESGVWGRWLHGCWGKRADRIQQTHDKSLSLPCCNAAQTQGNTKHGVPHQLSPRWAGARPRHGDTSNTRLAPSCQAGRIQRGTRQNEC